MIHSNQSTIEIVSNTRETSFDSFDDRVMDVERAALKAIILDVAEDDIRHCNVLLGLDQSHVCITLEEDLFIFLTLFVEHQTDLNWVSPVHIG